MVQIHSKDATKWADIVGSAVKVVLVGSDGITNVVDVDSAGNLRISTDTYTKYNAGVMSISASTSSSLIFTGVTTSKDWAFLGDGLSYIIPGTSTITGSYMLASGDSFEVNSLDTGSFVINNPGGSAIRIKYFIVGT